MRIFGFIIILAGLATAFGYPFYHDAFTNFEIGKYTIYDKDSGYEDQTIWLAPEDAPIGISFSAIAESADSKVAILVEVQNGENTLRTDTVEFSTQPTNTSASNAATGELRAELADFKISDGALYAFTFKDGNALPETALNSVSMTVTGIVVAPNGNIPTIGYVLIGFGALMYLVGGRRRTKKVGNAPSGKTSKTSQIGRRAEKTPPPAKKSKSTARKWGRDADN